MSFPRVCQEKPSRISGPVPAPAGEGVLVQKAIPRSHSQSATRKVPRDSRPALEASREVLSVDVGEIRSSIPALSKHIYMNTGSSGPCPKRVVEALVDMERFQNYEGPVVPDVAEEVHSRYASVRPRVARFIGADPDETALLQNTSEGVNTVAAGIDWREGDEVVISAFEHSTGYLPWFYLRDRKGINVRIVGAGGPSDAVGQLALDDVRSALTGRTRLVCMSHVAYCSGARLPVEGVARLAARRGIPFLVDGAQAAGAICLDVHELGCDFYALPGQKWLLGPEGTGAFYCRRDRLETLGLRGVAWASTDSSSIWEGYRVKAGAARFELATVNESTFVAMGEAVDFLSSVGMREIEARIAELCGHLKRELLKIPGVRLFTPVDARESAGIVAFDIAGWEPERAVEALFKEWKIVSRSIPWPRAVRVSIHFFNTEEEVEILVKAVRTIAGGAG